MMTSPSFLLRLPVFCITISLVLCADVKLQESTQEYLCGDKSCTKALSRARTSVRYPAHKEGYLSIDYNDDIFILGKPVGVEGDLIAMVRGKIGLVPHHLVTEFDIRISKPEFSVHFSKLPVTLTNEILSKAENIIVHSTAKDSDILGGTKDSTTDHSDANLTLEKSSQVVHTSPQQPEDVQHQVQKEEPKNASTLVNEPGHIPLPEIPMTSSAHTHQNERDEFQGKPTHTQATPVLSNDVNDDTRENILGRITNVSKGVSDETVTVSENISREPANAAQANGVLSANTAEEIVVLSPKAAEKNEVLLGNSLKNVSEVVVVQDENHQKEKEPENNAIGGVPNPFSQKSPIEVLTSSEKFSSANDAQDPKHVSLKDDNESLSSIGSDIPEEEQFANAVSEKISAKLPEEIAPKNLEETNTNQYEYQVTKEDLMQIQERNPEPINSIDDKSFGSRVDDDKISPTVAQLNSDGIDSSFGTHHHHPSIDSIQSQAEIPKVETDTNSSADDNNNYKQNEAPKFEAVSEEMIGKHSDATHFDAAATPFKPEEIAQAPIDFVQETSSEEIQAHYHQHQHERRNWYQAINEVSQEVDPNRYEPTDFSSDPQDHIHHKTSEYLSLPEEVSSLHDHHDHHHDSLFHVSDDHNPRTSSVVIAIRHLSSTLISFLPEYMQDTILDTNDALVFTGIIALTLVSICVPYFFIETFLSVRPLKRKVTELNKTLWKVSTAYENQQEEFDMYKQKALAYDEDKREIEELELQLHLVKQIESKLKEENRSLKKRLNSDVKVAAELERLIKSTMNERDHIMDERDKLRTAVITIQNKLTDTVEELEKTQADSSNTQVDLELLTHRNDNLERRSKIFENEIGELKTKLHIEIDLRRGLQATNETLLHDKHSISEELLDLKSVLHKYEDIVSSLNDEVSLKENELMALKETLGEDSPLVDIAEISAKFKIAEGNVTSLQARVESLTLESARLSRDYNASKENVKSLQLEKDRAETRLGVLEAYFKEKEEELRRVVEKHEAEKEVRGKDKDELVHMIEEKNDIVRDFTQRLQKLKGEFDETKLAHRNEIRALESKGHETWLSLCQSERKAQDFRKEAELLRQKLTAIAKAKEVNGNDVLSSNGDVPYILPSLDLDEIPLPLPDDPILPSYFGLGDFEPPIPLDDDEEEVERLNSMDNHNHHTLNRHEPQRPPPVGRMSPNYSDQDDDDTDFSPVRRGVRPSDFSDGSPSPPLPFGSEVGSVGGESRENYMSRSLHSRRRQPLNTSSPIQHGLNL